MPKNPVSQSDDEQDRALVRSQAAEDYLSHYLPDRNAEAYPLSQLTAEMGITGPKVAAADLVDREFVILGAKPFGSAFNLEKHAYYCVIRLQDDGKIYTTVLGGNACVEIIDLLAKTDFTRPVLVTLHQIEGGRFGRYYVLE